MNESCHTYQYVGPSHEEYRGYFEHNLPHGKGIMVWPNGSRYEGEWKRGKSHGISFVCSLLQFVAEWLLLSDGGVLQCGAVWCSVVQCVALCCTVLHCVALFLHCVALFLHCVALCRTVSSCVKL